jgi:hypothetical protein
MSGIFWKTLIIYILIVICWCNKVFFVSEISSKYLYGVTREFHLLHFEAYDFVSFNSVEHQSSNTQHLAF